MLRTMFTSQRQRVKSCYSLFICVSSNGVVSVVQEACEDCSLHSPPPPPTGVWCEQHQGDHTRIQQAKLEERWNIRTAACCNPPAPQLHSSEESFWYLMYHRRETPWNSASGLFSTILKTLMVSSAEFKWTKTLRWNKLGFKEKG